MENLNKASSTNQIKSKKNNIERLRKPLPGHIAGSFNAAHVRPIQYCYTLPNQPLHEMKFFGSIKLLTPKSPVYQNLNITFTTVKVPYGAIWKNWAKFFAYKGGVNEEKISEIPNYGGKYIPTIEIDGASDNGYLCNTSAWRDSSTSAFLPRTIAPGVGLDDDMGRMPKGSILPLRANRVAWNRVFRDKRYEEEMETFEDDTVSTKEWYSYMPDTVTKLQRLKQRSKLPDSYYTNYRTDLQGLETELPDETNPETALAKWIKWENQIDFARQTALDEMKMDEIVIGELFDGAPALENQVEIIGKVTQPLNYSAVTQSAYNNNNQIDENYRTMGTQGAYSYTQFNGLPLFKNRIFKEPCVILVYAQVWADVVYTTAFDRMDLNVNILDVYRPDLIGQKEDVLYAIESGTKYYSTLQEDYRMDEILGYKRKFSEYFKLRNSINADACQEPILQYVYEPDDSSEEFAEHRMSGAIIGDSTKEYLTNYTYNFYESTRYYTTLFQLESNDDSDIDIVERQFQKEPYKDYSDLIINRNLAIPGDVLTLTYYPVGATETGTANLIQKDCVINGQNQIQYGGIIILDTTLNIENARAIEENYTEYGEH